MIGRLHHIVLDCPDPAALAEFWSELLGLPVTHRSADFTVVAVNDRASGFAFQRVADHRPPRWPDPEYPQQIHPDVMVDDPDAAGTRVVALGATPLAGDHIYADPAGHPFCLVPRPAWAPAIGASPTGR